MGAEEPLRLWFVRAYRGPGPEAVGFYVAAGELEAVRLFHAEQGVSLPCTVTPVEVPGYRITVEPDAGGDGDGA